MIIGVLAAGAVLRVSYLVARGTARGTRVLAREWRDELSK